MRRWKNIIQGIEKHGHQHGTQDTDITGYDDTPISKIIRYGHVGDTLFFTKY